MSDNTHFKIPSENISHEKIIPSGGGKSFTRDNYSEHGKIIYEKAIKVKKLQNSKKDSRLTENYYLEIESPSNFKIKQAKNSIEKLGFEIINYSKENDSIATVKISKSLFEQFESKVDDYATKEGNPNKSYISPIEDIRDIEIEEKITKEINIESDEPQEIIVSLYNVLSSKEKKAILASINEELNNYSISSETHTFINGLTTITCIIPQNKLKEVFEPYATIREISRNHIAVVEQSIIMQGLPNPLNISNPLSNSKIGIIDTGIESTIKVFENLIEKRVPFLPSGCHNSPNDHGTFVASRCLFGDNIDNCLSTHQLEPYCKVIDIPVFGVDPSGVEISPTEIHLMKALEYVIPNNSKNIKVYNVSLGFNYPISNNTFSPLAKLIDYLSKKYGVLFIISAGNIRSPLGVFPTEHFENSLSRINSPAESLLSISVGSIAKFDSAISMSKCDELSPFSRIGPGADGGVKPELVSHGGNLADNYTAMPRLASYGIDKDGKNLSVDNGTSFSAPIIAQYAQRLFDLYPSSDTNLVKALLFHFAKEKQSFYNEP